MPLSLPSNEDASLLMAKSKEYYSQWRLNEAQTTLEQLLTAPGKFEAPALNLYADVLWSLADAEGARVATRKALLINPLDHTAAKRAKWLGITLDADRLSLDWIERIIATDQKPQILYPSLIRVLNEEGCFDEALTFINQAETIFSSIKVDPRILNKLFLERAIAEEGVGDITAAIETLSRIDRNLPVGKSAQISLGRLLHESGQFREAEKILPVSEGDAPKFNVTRYHIYLSTGRIHDAFKLYQERRETAIFRALIANYSIPPNFVKGGWARKKILAIAEGGPGDELRMSSLYGEVLANCEKVTFSCDPRLENLFRRTYPEASFIASPRSRDELRRTDYADRNNVRDQLGAKILTNTLLMAAEQNDFTVSVFDFLAELRPDRQSFKSPLQRDLQVDEVLFEEFSEIFDPEMTNIGLAWRSMIVNSTRQKHYFEPEDFYHLSTLKDTVFWVLQPNFTSDEITRLRKFLHVEIIPNLDLVDDFESQAAAIKHLDLVIAPCTTTAELGGAVGTKTLILANTHLTAWRQNIDGTDIWHRSGLLIIGDKVGDRRSVIIHAEKAVKDEDHLSNYRKTIQSTKATYVSAPTYSKKAKKTKKSGYNVVKHFVAKIPGARLARQKVRNIWLRLYVKESSARESFAIEALSKKLLRQKEVTSALIAEAEIGKTHDSGDTMTIVKATLQARSGRLKEAINSAAPISRSYNVLPSILSGIRTEMADIGRHDLSQAGLKELLDNQSGDAQQMAVRLGNASFEAEAFSYMAKLKQPCDPKGYAIIFSLNNRVTLGLTVPLSLQLVKDGYHVCSTVAAAMPVSDRDELKGISGSIRWSGLSLTDEPFKSRKTRNDWVIDLENKIVECDGINYFTFFAERLSKLSNSYNIDLSSPKVLSDFESLLQRSDVALTVCKRSLALARLGKPVRFVAMDTHFAPAGIVRKWCEVVGADHDINLVAISISYENYYSNLSTLEANTISIENMTKNTDLRHPLFGGRHRFDRFIASDPNVCKDLQSVLTHVKINRSRTEDGSEQKRQEILSKMRAKRDNGGKVFAAFGKVLIDFAAPYDQGNTFDDFAQWITFLCQEIENTDNLLLVKPHPHEKRTEIAASGVQILRDLLPVELHDNVIFLDHDSFNSYELADLVDVVFLWNGTAYAEFPLLGVPVVAESIWAEKDYPINGTVFTRKSDYIGILSGRNSITVSRGTVERATAYLQFMKSPEVAIPFGFVRRAGTNQSIGASSFIYSDMEKLISGELGSLDVITSRFFSNED